MTLDLEDGQLRITLKPLTDDRRRLTVDYPSDETHRKRVMESLATMMRSEASGQRSPSDLAEAA